MNGEVTLQTKPATHNVLDRFKLFRREITQLSDQLHAWNGDQILCVKDTAFEKSSPSINFES